MYEAEAVIMWDHEAVGCPDQDAKRLAMLASAGVTLEELRAYQGQIFGAVN